jgi:predicted PurR-regulated permease PerM
MQPRDANRELPAGRPAIDRDAVFIRRVLIVAGVVALSVALYVLSDVLLLVFGAVIVGLGLRALAEPISKHAGLPDKLALLVSVLLIVAALGLPAYFYGDGIVSQIEFVVERLPAAFGSLTRELEIGSLRELVPTSSIGNLAARALAWGTTLFGAVASLVLVLVAGIYFAADPDTYRTGLVKLFPVGWHEQIKATIGDVEVALRRWLGGQLVAMLIVGILVAIGMWAIGVPSPIALGLIAGLTEFVPLIGPFAGAIPALLLASTQGTDTLLWAIAVFIAVQQIENNAIMPIIARESVEVPPALGLFAVVAFGVLLGPLGLLFGYPLAVVADAVVRRLWVREALGESVETPTERVERHEAEREAREE